MPTPYIHIPTSVTKLRGKHFSLVQEFVLKQLHHGTPKGYMRKAQAKILAVMVYYIVMGSLALSTYSYFLATDDGDFEAYTTYFNCQSVGIVPDRDCGEPPSIQTSALHRLATASFFLQGFLPTVILIFVVSCSNKRLGKMRNKLRQTLSLKFIQCHNSLNCVQLTYGQA